MNGGARSFHPSSAPRTLKTVLLSFLAFTVSLASSIAWKVSDADFATKVGADSLASAYVLTAFMLFLGAGYVLSRLKRGTPQAVFFAVQKISAIAFGTLAIVEGVFHISQFTSVIFILKVIGYGYSALVINAFWIGLDYYNERTRLSAGECTFFSFCTYLGMLVAGVCLQSNTIGASQLGLLVACCSVVCWIIGRVAYSTAANDLYIPAKEDVAPRNEPFGHTIWQAIRNSSAVMTLVVGSVLLNVLVMSTEYSFLADFESRYISLSGASGSMQSVGTFVTMIGFGNILTLISYRVWSRFCLARAALPVATVLALITIRVGFTDCHSIIASVLALIVVESLYPLVVESNMNYLLSHFPSSERMKARMLIETIAEPVGVFFTAILFALSWIDIHTMGISVVLLTVSLAIFSWYMDASWRQRRMVSVRSLTVSLASRCCTWLVMVQTLLPCIEHHVDFSEDLKIVEGYNWLCIPAIEWADEV